MTENNRKFRHFMTDNMTVTSTDGCQIQVAWWIIRAEETENQWEDNNPQEKCIYIADGAYTVSYCWDAPFCHSVICIELYWYVIYSSYWYSFMKPICVQNIILFKVLSTYYSYSIVKALGVHVYFILPQFFSPYATKTFYERWRWRTWINLYYI